MRKNKEYNIQRKYAKKQLIIVFMLLIFAISSILILGRYVIENIRSFYSRSKEFYFYSDKLGETNPSYQIENWSGVDNYTITINMNSNKNNLLSASYDIEYDISYICSNNIICQLSKESGIIYSSTNTDYFHLVITPTMQLKTGDNVFIEITAKTSAPYEKTIKGRFTLIVGQEEFSYEIMDSNHSPYLMVNMTNTLSYYIVSEAFDSYTVGEKISTSIYLELTEDKRKKCYSTIVTLAFDPNYVLLDMTSSSYLNSTTITHINKNSYDYINSISFKVEAESSGSVRFYKIDETVDYTYPGPNSQSIIAVQNI